MKKKIDIRQLSLEELTAKIKALGEKKFRAKQVHEWLWKKRAIDFSQMTNLSKSLRNLLEENFIINDIAPLAISANTIDALDCDDINSGSINLQIQGGTSPYNVVWSSGETTEDLENIAVVGLPLAVSLDAILQIILLLILRQCRHIRMTILVIGQMNRLMDFGSRILMF